MNPTYPSQSTNGDWDDEGIDQQKEEQAALRCPHCKSGLLWSEDRGAHCDGCDDFDPETDSPNVKAES